ncbi:MAG: cysteine peptidase family C39 domain-containing protein [Capnocytophaga sp.]|nr:cysteine peptidase family C39 domain-containing protein [Capnocytophaga sp.]
MKIFPQLDEMDCGPACLAMITYYYGKKYSVAFLRNRCFLTREGVSLLDISEVASELGFKTIYDRLQSFFKGKTVIVIAHRLSTVKNADKIIVLKEGGIIEQGSHNELVSQKKEYYSLIKNQLELGQ